MPSSSAGLGAPPEGLGAVGGGPPAGAVGGGLFAYGFTGPVRANPDVCVMRTRPPVIETLISRLGSSAVLPTAAARAFADLNKPSGAGGCFTAPPCQFIRPNYTKEEKNRQGGAVKQPPAPEGLFKSAKARAAAVGKTALEPNREINVSITGGLVLMTHTSGLARTGPVNPYAKRPPPTAPAGGPPPTAPKPSGGAPNPAEDDGINRGRRDSFAALVADVTGTKTNVGGYQVQILGIEMRKENMESNKEVAMYVASVAKGGMQWTIYRRFQQFEKLHKALKSKALLDRWDESLPKKSPDANAMVQPLQNFVDNILAHPTAGPHYYVANFLEPLQLGDLKPGQMT
eukprot:TRINITY_DN6449_c0_g1_i1.p1 TRINITY_DN6449_c0_g1~~TRINITY_DN6449_c0_g1_i1.p1  ORF type:complete len:344 (-),score=61.93 TRINITY_DN6449_c0_g1_i1:88-1119(-)